MDENNLVSQVIEAAKFSLQNDRHPACSLLANKYGEIIAQSSNLTVSELDPTAHSEILSIREASRKIRSLDLSELTLYTTIEPCIMCLNACYWAKIKHIVYILGKDQLSARDYEGSQNSKEYITKLNFFIKLEQNTLYEDKMKTMMEIWEDRRKKYWNKK
jgi:tRNA(Arg) A34 adenosine deaminase TadA